MKYWLFKSEPNEFSLEDLEREKIEPWDGVRNYQARNFFRDDMKKGDRVLFYHSNVKEPGVVGEASIVSKAYPDPTQFDPKDSHYDAKSKKENPRWLLVDVKFEQAFHQKVTLEYLKSYKKYADMPLTQKGSRLSIQPVSKQHFDAIVRLSK